MTDEKRPDDEHPDDTGATEQPETGGTDPDDLPDGSGSDGGPSRTADGGDDDQFQG